MRVVAVSDTHLYRPEIPAGDVLIHAGDICGIGKREEWESEILWLGRQTHKYKLYVGGNHDRYPYDNEREATTFCAKNGIHMLICKSIDIDGVRFYGDPWTPVFGWTQAWMHTYPVAIKHWAKMPKCDVLITHGPPAGILDRVRGVPVGCPELLYADSNVQPRLHIFGHIHTEAFGHVTQTWQHGQTTHFINVCCKDGEGGFEKHPMTAFDITKESFSCIC